VGSTVEGTVIPMGDDNGAALVEVVAELIIFLDVGIELIMDLDSRVGIASRVGVGFNSRVGAEIVPSANIVAIAYEGVAGFVFVIIDCDSVGRLLESLPELLVGLLVGLID
jgi:hypothetical protein